MNEGGVGGSAVFVASGESSEVSEPRDGAFDFPPFSVSSEWATILGIGLLAVFAMGTDQFDAALLQPVAQGVAVVGAVGDQARGVAARASGLAVADLDGAERLLDERDFRRAGRVDGHAQRNSLAICQNHKLCALSALGLADAFAPFFAGANVPSMKHSSQSMRCCSLISDRNARQTSSQTPCSSQSFNRRQHVLGLGYCLGRSTQRAPVRSTHKIPSNTGRFGLHRRPRLVIRGNSGPIFDHCSSVSNAFRLIRKTLL